MGEKNISTRLYSNVVHSAQGSSSPEWPEIVLGDVELSAPPAFGVGVAVMKAMERTQQPALTDRSDILKER